MLPEPGPVFGAHAWEGQARVRAQAQRKTRRKIRAYINELKGHKMPSVEGMSTMTARWLDSDKLLDPAAPLKVEISRLASLFGLKRGAMFTGTKGFVPECEFVAIDTAPPEPSQPPACLVDWASRVYIYILHNIPGTLNNQCLHLKTLSVAILAQGIWLWSLPFIPF